MRPFLLIFFVLSVHFLSIFQPFLSNVWHIFFLTFISFFVHFYRLFIGWGQFLCWLVGPFSGLPTIKTTPISLSCALRKLQCSSLKNDEFRSWPKVLFRTEKYGSSRLTTKRCKKSHKSSFFSKVAPH